MNAPQFLSGTLVAVIEKQVGVDLDESCQLSFNRFYTRLWFLCVR